jgi:antirestriction protein
MASKETPRIYVACLAAYNAGKLHGEWLDLADYADADELKEAVQEMLARSSEPGAEEHAIHDYENWGGIELHEYESLDRVWELGQAIVEHDDSSAVIAAIENWPSEWQQALEEYAGVYERPGDYAEEFVEETGDLKAMGQLAGYIDWERYERDMELNGDITVVVSNGKRHVFRSF